MRLKLREALRAYNKINSERKFLKDIAPLLWPQSRTLTQRVNMTNLSAGHQKTVPLEFIPILCRELECSADFLFGIEQNSPLNQLSPENDTIVPLEECNG